MLNLKHLQEFASLDDALEKRDISYRLYQASEYYIRKALDDHSSVTRFEGQDFSIGYDSLELQNYFECFKETHNQEWAFQPLQRSGVSAEKLSSQKQLQETLDLISSELHPFCEKSKVVDELQEKIKATVERMRKKLDKEVSELNRLYSKADFWDEQQILYLSASKLFYEKFFDSFLNIDDFIKIKNDLYFQSEKSKHTLRMQIQRCIESSDVADFLKHLDTLKVEKVMRNFDTSRKISRAG